MKPTKRHTDLLPKLQEAIARAIAKHGSKSSLSKQMRRSAGHITNFEKGNLKDISESVFDEFCAYFSVTDKPENWTILQTPTHRTVTALCEEAHSLGEFHAVCGYTGAGKSVALEGYCSRTPEASYMPLHLKTGDKSFLRHLQHALGIDEGGTSEVMLESVLLKLRKTRGKLLVFDDLHKVKESTMLLLQPIWEACKGRHGIVICGTEKLYDLFKRNASKNKLGFRELRRRVDHWQSLERPSLNTVSTIARRYGILDKKAIRFLADYSQDYDTLRKFILKGCKVANREGVPVNINVLKSLNVGDSRYGQR